MGKYTLPFLKEINIFILQECIKMIKSDSKAIYLYSSKNPEYFFYHSFHKNMM